MNRNDIIRMVEKAGLPTAWISEKGVFKWADLERFFRAAYEAGAAAEREACAQVCESLWNAAECADAIRARGEK
jgi:hypothetical protein